MEYIKNVAKIEINQEKCIGCGICKVVCPHAVIGIEKEKAYLISKDRCIECGACDINCPTQAIRVEAGVGCANALINGWLQGKFRKKNNSKPGCC